MLDGVKIFVVDMIEDIATPTNDIGQKVNQKRKPGFRRQIPVIFQLMVFTIYNNTRMCRYADQSWKLQKNASLSFVIWYWKAYYVKAIM